MSKIGKGPAPTLKPLDGPDDSDMVKKKTKKVGVITFDEKARSEFVTGFRKRKQERRAQAKKQNEEKARQEKLQERKERREAKAELKDGGLRSALAALEAEAGAEEEEQEDPSAQKKKFSFQNTVTTTSISTIDVSDEGVYGLLKEIRDEAQSKEQAAMEAAEKEESTKPQKKWPWAGKQGGKKAKIKIGNKGGVRKKHIKKDVKKGKAKGKGKPGRGKK